jgi:two-component system cell cycle sensor histidine kinase/response regulator CckA
LRALIIDDSEADAALVVRELARAGHEVESERVVDRPSMREALARARWDVVLCDSTLLHFSAFAALATLREAGLEVPFIIVAGSAVEEAALEALRAGARDFVLKAVLWRLPFAVERELRLDIDVAERKRAEEGLRRLAAIVETSTDGIVGMDPEALITTWNPGAQRIYGYSAREAIGKSISLLAPPGTPETALRLAERLRGGERMQDYETVALRKDGSNVDISMSLSVIRDAEGATQGLSSISRDITDRRVAERHVRQIQEQLQQAQKMEAIERLTGGIAHDFNNLLTVILSSAMLLLEGLGTADPRRENVKDVQVAGERAATLTRQLLAFSRRQALEPRPLDLNELVGNLEKLLQRLIGENIELETALSAGLGTVKADAGQIDQVIINLVVNARDAMAGGGKIRIETRNVELDGSHPHQGSPVQPGRYVLLAVSDTGIGMDAATLRRIFEPFFTTKKHGEGTGLGLSTCYGIVQQSGGSILVESEPGHGAVFKVYLPRISEIPQLMSARRKTPADFSGTERVLLVEDDDLLRGVVKKLLEARGYRVLATPHGRDALAFANRPQGRFDLVLTDVVMPGLTGPQMVARLRARQPEIKVLFMSGYMELSTTEPGAIDPATALIRKPFTPETLARKVREVLDG